MREDPAPIGLPIEPAATEPMTPAPAAVLGKPEPFTWQPKTPGESPKRRESARKARGPRDFEDLVSGRGLAWVGGLAILGGAIFFLSLAFSRGWIGPEARVTIGGVAAASMLAVGAWLFGRREALLGHVLVAVGLGVMTLSLIAATRLYDLIPIEVGLLGVILTAFAAAMIAIRADLQVVAAYGLIFALAAPPILGASAGGVTIAFLSAILVGSTLIALYRSWTWLPSLAFLFSAPQLAFWLLDDEPARRGALVAIIGFWALNTVATGGEGFRRGDAPLRGIPAMLFRANTAFLVWAGLLTLDGDASGWRGAFLLLVAVAHGVIGGSLMRRDGMGSPLGLLAAGTGVAVLTLAVPVQLNGAAVAMAWASQAALIWFHTRFTRRASVAFAIALEALVIGHLLLFEYPLAHLTDDLHRRPPFLNADGLTLAYVVGAAAVVGYFWRNPLARHLLAALGLALAVYAAPFELSGIWLAIGWATLFMAAALIQQTIAAEPEPESTATEDARLGLILAWASFPTVATTALALVIGHLLAFEYPLAKLTDDLHRRPPFLNAAGVVLAYVIGTAAVGGVLWRNHLARRLLAGLGLALAVYAAPFELSGVWLVVGWAALGVAATMMQGWLAAGPRSQADGATPGSILRANTPAAAVVALAVAHLVSIELPLDRVGDFAEPRGHFTDRPALGAGLVMLVAAIAAIRAGERRSRQLWAATALAVAAYLAPFEVGAAATVVAWAVLSVVGGWVAGRERDGERFDLRIGGSLLAAGFALTMAEVAPLSRLGVHAHSSISHPPFLSGASAALAASAAGCLLLRRRLARWPKRRWLAYVSAALTVYLLSVGIVDIFQRQIEGGTGLESLQKRAQVALSILWATLGMAAFVTGIVRLRAPVRVAGLVLLGIATVKVFVYDLASLDALYRVLSFIGLGLLLLTGSFVYQRVIHPQTGGRDESEVGNLEPPSAEEAEGEGMDVGSAGPPVE
ncbi:MAG: DUF2339 domain-containing protein [Thermomicrobiales bacterium]